MKTEAFRIERSVGPIYRDACELPDNEFDEPTQFLIPIRNNTQRLNTAYE